MNLIEKNVLKLIISIAFALLSFLSFVDVGCKKQNDFTGKSILSIWVEYSGPSDFPTDPLILTKKILTPEEVKNIFGQTEGFKEGSHLYGGKNMRAFISQFEVSEDDIKRVCRLIFNPKSQKTFDLNDMNENLFWVDNTVKKKERVDLRNFNFVIVFDNDKKSKVSKRLDLNYTKSVFDEIEKISANKNKELFENILITMRRLGLVANSAYKEGTKAKNVCAMTGSSGLSADFQLNRDME
jgi:hypothetical protein